MYQFFVNTPDEQVGELLRYLTFLDRADIEALDAETAEHAQRRAGPKALARAVVGMVHGEAEVAKCEEASSALFSEEIAGLSEEMLLAVTEDSADDVVVPRRDPRGPDARRRTGAHRTGHVEGRRTADHRPGWCLRQQRPADRRRSNARPGRPAARPLRGAAQGPAGGPHHRRRMRRKRPVLVPILVLLVGSALLLTSCAGADQEGSTAHRMSVWASGTSLGEDIGTLIADNTRVPKDVPNGTGAVHARVQHAPQRCGDGQHGVALARPRGHRPAHPGLRARGVTPPTSATTPAATNTKLLLQSERNGIKAEALYNEVLQRIRQIDGKVVSTTTTTDNSTGGIFG